MMSVLINLVFGVFLFLCALVIIPRLLRGDPLIYEVAIPFSVTLVLSIIFLSNLNISILLAIGVTLIVRFLRSRNII
ncbi:hypothetical protein HY029_01165 [Candidatus Gottesmanbacteria bacterium]|nr:hypothetical protein [Candidatus Gottesmanbacteria bacterium]